MFMPCQVSDYRSHDAAGREVEILLLGEYVLTYWIDHALKEVRIVEIVRT